MPTARAKDMPQDGFDLAWVTERLAGRSPRGIPLGKSGRDWRSTLTGSKAPNKRAAVAAILRDAARGPEVLLIRRAEHPGDPWSGHMAFPGGRAEPEDASLRQTAERETHEEIGWQLDQNGQLLGQLDDLPAVAGGRATGLVITPFVFAVQHSPPLYPNEEVSEVVWAPLGPMMRGELATEMPYKHGDLPLRLPAHDVGGRIAWGLTYRMLEQLFAALSHAR